METNPRETAPAAIAWVVPFSQWLAAFSTSWQQKAGSDSHRSRRALSLAVCRRGKVRGSLPSRLVEASLWEATIGVWAAAASFIAHPPPSCKEVRANRSLEAMSWQASSFASSPSHRSGPPPRSSFAKRLSRMVWRGGPDSGSGGRSLRPAAWHGVLHARRCPTTQTVKLFSSAFRFFTSWMVGDREGDDAALDW